MQFVGVQWEREQKNRLEVESYRTLPEEELKAAALNLYNKYVALGSPFELNITDQDRTKLMQMMDMPNTEIFNSLQAQIFTLMATVIFSFLKMCSFRLIIDAAISDLDCICFLRLTREWKKKPNRTATKTSKKAKNTEIA